MVSMVSLGSGQWHELEVDVGNVSLGMRFSFSRGLQKMEERGAEEGLLKPLGICENI